MEELSERGLRIGRTGGMGCGKSTVAGFFANAGWSVLSTDVLVRDLLASDAEVIDAVREYMGEAVFDEEFENQKRGRNFAYKPIFVNEKPRIGDIKTVEITDATVHSLIGKIIR